MPTQIDRFILLKSFALRFSLKAEVHSNEIIERVKHFFQFIFSEAFTSLTNAEALWRLPCQWKRIIGRWIFMATLFCKKNEKSDRSFKLPSKRRKRGHFALFKSIIASYYYMKA
ncbi:hypothetical protein BIY21_05980 [Vibrio ponticus]|uniref:Uncharacterized protein n=1 Tax=Vibrio ponticus TaxID=265668 RepID=A0ABX3FNJ1_9VIBR|nr:hypothetical protein BIY21_05980 [Vibrio ponticus]